MEVLIISHTFPPDMGGASSRAWSVAKGLTKHGHHVQVVAARSYYPHGRVSPQNKHKFFFREKREGVDILRVWIPALETAGLAKRLVLYFGFTIASIFGFFLLVRNKYDVVHYSSPYSLSFFSIPACIFGRFKGSMVLLDVHDLWPEVILEAGMIESTFAERILGLGTRVTYALSSYVTPISDSIGQSLMATGMPKRKVKTLELAVDTDFFHPIARESLAGSADKGFLAEYSGLLGRKFDFEILIEAARALGNRGVEISFLIRGDGEMKNHVMNLAKGLRNVDVRTDLMSEGEVMKVLNLADVLLCPLKGSKEDAAGIPTKVIEYLAVGKPIVCSAIGDTASLLKAGNAGIVVPPGDSASFSDAILLLCQDRKLAEEKGKQARALAVARFSIDKLNSEIEALHGEYAGNRNIGRRSTV